MRHTDLDLRVTEIGVAVQLLDFLLKAFARTRNIVTCDSFRFDIFRDVRHLVLLDELE